MLKFESLQITYQTVIATNGKVSFAAFVYEEGGVGKIRSFDQDNLVGFDAGDQVKSAISHSLNSPGLQILRDNVTVFRIDGNSC